MDIDRSDAGKGYQADCTENDIFLGERPILAVEGKLYTLSEVQKNQFVPMDHPETRSAVFMQEDGHQ